MFTLAILLAKSFAGEYSVVTGARNVVSNRMPGLMTILPGPLLGITPAGMRWWKEGKEELAGWVNGGICCWLRRVTELRRKCESSLDINSSLGIPLAFPTVTGLRLLCYALGIYYTHGWIAYSNTDAARIQTGSNTFHGKYYVGSQTTQGHTFG